MLHCLNIHSMGPERKLLFENSNSLFVCIFLSLIKICQFLFMFNCNYYIQKSFICVLAEAIFQLNFHNTLCSVIKAFLKQFLSSGAAVVFLQLCILTTCLLCLYSNRRSKRRLSRSESLHSGRTSHTDSSHPTLHTLYHDQLTYR